MKTHVIILLVFGFISLNSCNRYEDPKVTLQDPEKRIEFFNAIAENQDYIAEFMETMQNNEIASQLMHGNKKLMEMIMKGNSMQMMIKDSIIMNDMMNNKEMMQSIMDEMMKDGNMVGNMMQMMYEKGMMSQECMKSGMNMMGDKGMPMDKNMMSGETN